VKSKYKLVIIALLFLDIVTVATLLLHGTDFLLLDSKGLIAVRERTLIILSAVVGLSIILPVIALTLFVAWKFRESNPNAKYTPDSRHSKLLELSWWALPTLVILILGAVMWKDTHVLDPYKPIQASGKQITIQVIALQWKWLFIYPEQNIATLNFVEIPERTPINFELTADAPMNSFWIPQLGGQMYAMAGMGTQVHLMADTTGDFQGSTAEMSGSGFTGMRFIARATSKMDFDAWVKSVKKSENTLNLSEYNKLSKPSEDNPVKEYASVEKDLYRTVIMKFMMPGANH